MPETVQFEAHDEEYQHVIITNDGPGNAKYEIQAYGDSISEPETTLYAGALNLNGFAFATTGFEVGEYGERVRLERDEGSRYVNVVIQPSEE